MARRVPPRKLAEAGAPFLPKDAYILPSTPGRIVAFTPGARPDANAMISLFVRAAQEKVLSQAPRQVLLDPTGRAVFGYLWHLDGPDVKRLVVWLYARKDRNVYAQKLAAFVLAAYDVSEAAR